MRRTSKGFPESTLILEQWFQIAIVHFLSIKFGHAIWRSGQIEIGNESGCPGGSLATHQRVVGGWTRQTMLLEFDVATYDRTCRPSVRWESVFPRKIRGARPYRDEPGGRRRSTPDRHRQNPRCGGAARNLVIDLWWLRMQLAKSIHTAVLSNDPGGGGDSRAGWQRAISDELGAYGS